MTRALPWLLAVVCAVGWFATADRLDDAREEAAMWQRNFRDLATRLDGVKQGVDELAVRYRAWLTSLAPLFERTDPVDLRVVHAEDDGGMQR